MDIPQPTLEQLASYESQSNTVDANNIVDVARKNSYGSWQEQLDEIYHDIDAWKTRLQKIKTDNPKG